MQFTIVSFFRHALAGRKVFRWAVFLPILAINLCCQPGQKNTPIFEKIQPENYREAIPKKAYQVRDYVRAHGKAMPNYVGGRVFKNLEKKLPIYDEKGKRIKYQEWDIHKKVRKRNRGAERLVTGSNGKDYYTANHYKSFMEMK